MFYRVARVIASFLLKIFYRIEITPMPDLLLKEENGVILCANHSTNLDPVLVGIAIPRQVHFMAKNELFQGKLANYLFHDLLGAFPVKRGESDLKAMKTAIRMVKDGHVLGLFPEGTRNKGEDIDSKAGVGFIVAKTGQPVIPISIYGSAKLFSKIKIHAGEPMDLSSFYERKLNNQDYQEISNLIMTKIRDGYYECQKQ